MNNWNGPLARKQKYCRNVGDVTSGGASATVLCTEKIGETGVLFVGCSRVLESRSLPRVCEQGEKVLVLRLATAFETYESAVARVKLKKIRCSCRQCPETPVSYAATSRRTTPVLPFIAFRKTQVKEQDGFERLESSKAS